MLYRYIGPESVRVRASTEPRGTPIRSLADLTDFARREPTFSSEGATFVVLEDDTLRLAPRRSEHVACASGAPVRAAGELALSLVRGRWTVTYCSNQSTGYCPDPACFGALATALDALGVARPLAWTSSFVLRRCELCAQIQVIKDEVYECAVCGAALERG
ncbi:MAG: hypothetical protein JNK05_27790 [Myxococcales bacterium]|nr:hypothetical protein [Myxococcales bacterium]